MKSAGMRKLQGAASGEQGVPSRRDREPTPARVIFLATYGASAGSAYWQCWHLQAACMSCAQQVGAVLTVRSSGIPQLLSTGESGYQDLGCV